MKNLVHTISEFYKGLEGSWEHVQELKKISRKPQPIAQLLTNYYFQEEINEHQKSNTYKKGRTLNHLLAHLTETGSTLEFSEQIKKHYQQAQEALKTPPSKQTSYALAIKHQTYDHT